VVFSAFARAHAVSFDLEFGFAERFVEMFLDPHIDMLLRHVGLDLGERFVELGFDLGHDGLEFRAMVPRFGEGGLDLRDAPGAEAQLPSDFRNGTAGFIQSSDLIEHGPAMHKRVLLVRIGAEMKAGVPDGFIVTFDDVTELLSAQRKAAWADVLNKNNKAKVCWTLDNRRWKEALLSALQVNPL